MTNRCYVYRDFVRTLNNRFLDNLNRIQTVHNFDYGDEFEIAICEMLRTVLPPKFGVCRGHVVDRDGRQAGDDILIFDRMLFPTLRLLPDEDYSRKEWIPIEAVYAYIEAKHSLRLEKKDCKSTSMKNTLQTALQQVRTVKELCNTREPTWEQLIGPFSKPSNKYVQANRMYAGILGRRVIINNEITSDPKTICSVLEDAIAFNDVHMPDLIIAGNSNIVLPGQKIWIQGFPFLNIENCGELGTKLHQVTVPEISFGIGLCIILQAITQIVLGQVSMIDIINDSLSPTPTPRPYIDRTPPHERGKHRIT
jgi:hypothetical protein